MHGAWYCGADCLEPPIAEIFRRDRIAPRRNGGLPHRVPLGLLLLSRQQLTAEQLRTGLELQREVGRGRIGEWLLQLGFVTEQQVTAALARQWSCPVLKPGAETRIGSRSSPIPLLLLESFQMIPVDFAESRASFLIAFCEAVDHVVLYAVEKMLGRRTEACFIAPSVLREGLQALKLRYAGNDIVFEHVDDAAECARIVGSYAAKVSADEVRLARCGEHVWVRMERFEREPVNLIFRASAYAPFLEPLYPATAGF
jgi:Type II secretion system (T2SS), protein E, N-terminal domain